MKYINYTFRILVGALFIFSGFIKSNDTKGFAIKLHEYFEVFSKDAQADQDTFTIQFESVYHSGSFSTLLYEKELNKTYTIKTKMTGDRYEILPDTAQDLDENYVEMGEMAVNFFQATNSILKDSLYAPQDSVFAGEVKVSASIKGQEIYSATHDLNLMPQEIVKAIDVSSYLKKSSFMAGFFQWMSTLATPMAMVICLLEILLGIWLLLGVNKHLTLWLLLLMTLFFTFLTFYSAYYDKVTDCGCFGDAIKLTPWESFWKDVILSSMILVLFFTPRFILPLLTRKASRTVTIVLMAFCTLFMAYSYLYLPVFDFLKYHEGSNLREKITLKEGALEQDIIEKTMIYKMPDGTEKSIVWNSNDNTPLPNEGEYLRTENEKIIEKADIPEIHDWGNIYSPWGNDISDSIMYGSSYLLLEPAVYINEIHPNVPAKLKEIYQSWVANGYSYYALTSSGSADIGMYREKYEVPYLYGTADNKLLMSMIRSNPGLILIKDGVVVKRWCFRSLPSVDELMQLTSQ